MSKLKLGTMVAVMLFICMIAVGAVSADTNVTVSGTGGGTISSTFNSGDDAVSNLGINAGYYDFTFVGTDYDNNPYGYGVDNTKTFYDVFVSQGSAFFDTVRTDSCESMYGVGGQAMVTNLFAGNGFVQGVLTTTTNYASLKSCNYSQPETVNGWQLEANADTYMISQYLYSNDGNMANAYATGSGIAQLDIMSFDTWNGSYKFGTGCGCYTNCDAYFNGAGSFTIFGNGDNGVTLHESGLYIPGDGSANSSSYTGTYVYSGEFTIPDFAICGD